MSVPIDKNTICHLRGEIRDAAGPPTSDELRARLERRAKVDPSLSPAQAVRTERER